MNNKHHCPLEVNDYEGQLSILLYHVPAMCNAKLHGTLTHLGTNTETIYHWNTGSCHSWKIWEVVFIWTKEREGGGVNIFQTLKFGGKVNLFANIFNKCNKKAVFMKNNWMKYIKYHLGGESMGVVFFLSRGPNFHDPLPGRSFSCSL